MAGGQVLSAARLNNLSLGWWRGWSPASRCWTTTKRPT